MGIATWQWAVVTMPSVLGGPADVVAYLDKPLTARYIRRRSNYSEVELEVVNENDVMVVEGAGYRRGIVGWRNGALRFHGTIVESRENADGYTIGARDPYYNFSWRRFDLDTTYTSLGDAEIAARVIEAQNAERPTWLLRGDIHSGANRTRKFLFGDICSEKIEYLSKLDNSFVFKIDPSTWGDIVNLAQGVFNTATTFDVHKPRAVFAFGDGTLANCLDFERTLRPYVSKAYVAYNAGQGAIEYAINVSGTETYGLWSDQRGQVNTTDRTVAQDAAAHAIANSSEPRYDITITPGPNAPQLFDDYDVFDAVPVMLRRHGRDVSGYKPVTSVTLSMDPDSGEELYEEIVVLDEDVL